MNGGGDLAISWMLLAYIGGMLALAALVAVGAMPLRLVQAWRIRKFAREPSADVAKVMREADSAIETAELGLEDISERSGAERRAHEQRVLEDLARVDALYARLRALRAPARASYNPAIAKLRNLAARNGLHPQHSRR